MCEGVPPYPNPAFRRYLLAIYHLHAQVLSRSAGQSAVAAAAYRSGERLEDERTQTVQDYTKKGGVLEKEILAPKDAPSWVQDREKLWNAVEHSENRKDSQLAREIRVALPHELSKDQNIELVRDFVRRNFTEKGMIADVAYHAPSRQGDDRNGHAHILLTTREISPDGFGKKNREWNKLENVEEWRKDWSKTVNQNLERAGHEARIDHRTLKAQGIDREPTEHRGKVAVALDRKIEQIDRAINAQERKKEATLGHRDGYQIDGARNRDTGIEEKKRQFQQAIGEGGRGQEGSGKHLAERDLGRVEREIRKVTDRGQGNTQQPGQSREPARREQQHSKNDHRRNGKDVDLGR